MIIRKIELENFLSFEKIRLDIGQNLSIILGKNESGKSNFFEALNVFKLEEIEYDKFSNRNIRIKGKNIKIKIFFEINDEIKREVEEKLKDKYSSIDFKIKNNFYFEKNVSPDNKIIFDSDLLLNWDLNSNDIKNINNKKKQYENFEKDINSKLNLINNGEENKKNINELLKKILYYQLHGHTYSINNFIRNNWSKNIVLEIKEILNIEGINIEGVNSSISFTKLIDELKQKIKEKSILINLDIEEIKNKIETLEKENINDGRLLKKENLNKEFWNLLNFNFIYWKYNKKYLLEEKISIEDFRSNQKEISIPLSNIFNDIIKEQDTTFEKLIKMASGSSAEKAKLISLLDKVLNQKFKKNWNSKNNEINLFKDIEFHFTISGDFFEISLKEKSSNTDDDNYSSFEDRSVGFKRMASILLSLSDNINNNILLIDEVETHIHIDGQVKLFDFLSSFSKKNQIIFSTISPFMISSIDNIEYLIFDKNDKHFTFVENKKYMDPNGISKIYGINIYDYFLNPKIFVLFEGNTDKEFFELILSKYDFNFKDIRFLPVNGASKIGQEIKYLIDINKNIKKIISIFDNDVEGISCSKKIEEKSKEWDKEISLFKLNDIIKEEHIQILEDIYPKEIRDKYLTDNGIKIENFTSFNNEKKLKKEKPEFKQELLDLLKIKNFDNNNFLLNDDNCKKIYEWFTENIKIK